MGNLSTIYIVQFDIASIILTTMLLVTLLMRRSFPTVAIKQYMCLLLCNIISSITDLISAYTICNTDQVPLALNYIINILFILSHNITSVFFLLYVISSIRKNIGLVYEKAMWISITSIISLFTLTTPFTKAIFYFDENGQYAHGPFLIVFYVLSAITIIYSIYLIIKFRHTLSSFQIGTNFAFIFLIIAAILLQNAMPELLIENFVIATACTMMNVALDNPANYFFRSSNCFNQNAFNANMEKRLESNSKFTLYTFTFDDLSLLKNQTTDSELGDLIIQTTKRAQSVAGKNNVYFLHNEIIAVISEKISKDKTIEYLEEKLNKPFKLLTEKEINTTFHFSILNFPGEAKSVNEINLVIQDTMTHVYRKTGDHIIKDSSKLLNDLRREEEVVHVIRDAIRTNSIHVVYQPIFNIKTGKFDSAEALMRLQDKIYPDEFIPIAENNGLIVDIGEIIFEKVCRFINESSCRDFGLKQININLSMIQLLDPNLSNTFIEICNKNNVSPNSIVLEITETATEGDETEKVLNNISALKKAGFSLSLDDYGTGYSNLTNFLKYSLDQVKIDKVLLWNAIKSSDSMVILENIIKLIQNFDMTCLVEGVEDENMSDILKKLNVDLLQGYLFSKPIPGLAMAKFLSENNK